MTKRVVTTCGMLGLAGAALIGTAMQARADRRAEGFRPFSLDGFQESGATTLTVQGECAGKDATWTHVIGPVVGSTVGDIPGEQNQGASFSGAACQFEYSQDQFSANGGRDTFTADVYSLSCQPFSQPAALLRNGTFNIVGGTGVYRNLTGGGGSIQVSSQADGSVILHLAGNLIARGDAYRQF
jgi:hypothetical protein